MFTSIVKLYGSGFGGGDVGRREVTDETMQDKKTIEKILKIGWFWNVERSRSPMSVLSKVVLDKLDAIKRKYPTETVAPGWVEHKDHMRFIWGFTVGRRAAVLFKQGLVSEDELYEEM